MANYGKRVREAVAKAKRKSSARYKCPSCSRNAVKRDSSGVWRCGKCGTKYASAAYEFRKQ
jgi:large subunit ribosomal protein L37Ae